MSTTENKEHTWTVCNIYIEDFLSRQLDLFDKCEICDYHVGRHLREKQQETTNVSETSITSKKSNNILSGTTIAIMKLQSQFPTFDKSTDVRTFLQRIELVLDLNEGIPRGEWSKVFLYIIKDITSGKWIKENIIDAQLDWEAAKKKFISHFQRAEYTSQLIKKYTTCKQEKDETVQSYGDRFIDVVTELDRKDNDPLVIAQFIENLHSNIRNKFQYHLTHERISKMDRDYQYDSLTVVIDICIMYDIQTAVSSSSNSSGTKAATKSDGKADTSSKWCEHHKSKTHNTSECKGKSGASKSGSSGGMSGGSSKKDLSHINCFKCKQSGHFANRCPNEAVPDTPKPNAPLTFIPSAPPKRTAGPPEKLSYSAPGVQTTSVNINAKAATLIDGSGSTKTPSRVWLYDTGRNAQYSCLVDSGADISFIDATLAKQLGLQVQGVGGTIDYANVKFKSERIGKTSPLPLTAMLAFSTNDIACVPTNHCFELMELDTSKHQFVIGSDLLTVLFPDHMPSGFYSRITNKDGSRSSSVGCHHVSINNVEMDKIDTIEFVDQMVGFQNSIAADDDREQPNVSTPAALEEEYGKVRNEILNDPEVQEAVRINESLSGFCTLPEAVVHLEVDPEFARTGYRKQYGIPAAAHDAVTLQVDKWLANGKIELAAPNCPYNSSLTVASKKDAHGVFTGYRVCLDTRMLNNSIKLADKFELPYIRDILEKFHGCRFFGELDLSEAYLQFPLHPDSRPYTAFTWHGRQYQFVGCPFGISLLPSYFQRVMWNVLFDLVFTVPYLDNFPFGSKTIGEHKQHLLALLIRCNEFNLQVKIPAMKIAHSQMNCLGHLLTREGVALSPSKLEFISNAERPKTGKQLQSFLGAVTFLRGNIRHIGDITSSLEAAKTTKGDLEWTEQMIADFELVKNAVAAAPKLAYPDFSKPFHIACDASNVGVGGVLYQPDEVGGDITVDNIVALVSKKLSGAQLNYPAYKKEFLAVVYCLKKFRNYVWGRDDLVVFTDHKPLTYIFEQRELSPSIQQWLDILLDFNFTIHYRPGILNILPDALSRLYEQEYDGSDAWGIPKIMPWKVVGAPVADAVQAAAAGVSEAETFVDGGGNVESNASTLTNDEQLVQIAIAIEKSGYTIPKTNEKKLELIQREHAFGHFGRDAVCAALIAKKYWWSGMRTMVIDELANCDACARFTVVRNGFNPSGYITADGPWCHIQLDTSVHLPTAPGGYTTLLIIIDVFTGFIILRPMKTTSAELVANEVWSIFCVFGLPKIIQSDNGPEFVNEVIRTLVKLTGVEHRFISPYNPRADGKVERSIQTIMGTIKKMLHGNSSNWTLYVPFAQLAFNNKISALTGSSPFTLMFGRNLNPIKDYTVAGTGNDEGTVIDINDWNTHMEKVQSLIYPAILERTIGRKDKMVQRLDKQRRLLTTNAFPVGAVVMLRDPLRQNKFEPKYVGPYSIVRRTRNGNYQLRDETGGDLERHIPPDQLKLVSKKPREQDLESSVYEIEKLLGHRGEAGAYEYHVKWKGYRETTWEPAESFRDTALITDYWKSINQAGV